MSDPPRMPDPGSSMLISIASLNTAGGIDSSPGWVSNQPEAGCTGAIGSRFKRCVPDGAGSACGISVPKRCDEDAVTSGRFKSKVESPSIRFLPSTAATLSSGIS